MIIAVTSWRGVGATTVALLVAASIAEHDEAWFVEADPAGGTLSGRMIFAPHELGGLERVAFPVELTTPAESLHAVAQHRGRLHLVTTPADPFRGHACHAPRVPWVPALHDLPGSVVIDIGRVRAGTPARPVLAMADVVLLVTSPEVSSAVSTAEWVQAAGRVSASDPGLDEAEVRVVVVDAPTGLGFARSTLRSEHWDAWLPWDPAAVDLIHRGAEIDDRRLRRNALVDAVRDLTDSLMRQEATVS
ncbi:MAG: hypothetical protein HY828_04725 [Actinobacteria bacterium]|nr:hypothetical protein [Actinomycetota bacterium]